MAGLLRYALEYGRNVEKHESAMASQKQAREINQAASARLKIENERADQAYRRTGTMRETADVLQAYKTGNKFKVDQILNNKEGYLNKLGINKVIGGWGGVVPEGGIRFEKITPSVGIEPEKRETLRNMTTEDQDRIMNMVYPPKFKAVAQGTTLVNVSGGKPTPAFTAPAAEDPKRFRVSGKTIYQSQGLGAGRSKPLGTGAPRSWPKHYGSRWKARTAPDQDRWLKMASSDVNMHFGGKWDPMQRIFVDPDNPEGARIAKEYAEYLLQSDQADGPAQAATKAYDAALKALTLNFRSGREFMDSLKQGAGTGPETNTSIIEGSGVQRSLLRK